MVDLRRGYGRGPGADTTADSSAKTGSRGDGGDSTSPVHSSRLTADSRHKNELTIVSHPPVAMLSHQCLNATLAIEYIQYVALVSLFTVVNPITPRTYYRQHSFWQS